MTYQHLILLVSESCNFNCSYCYQTKKNHRMPQGLARGIIDFFYPRINQRLAIHFTGGESLLNYRLIKNLVLYLEKKNRILKKNIRYHITTNGSLITHDILNFLNTHCFNMELSFDGLSQEQGRKMGSYRPTMNVIREILKYPNIDLCINSVFAPDTVHLLSDSLAEIATLGIPSMELSLTLDREWPAHALATLKKELKKCGDHVLSTIAKSGHHPLGFFRMHEEPGIWRCSAGQDQLCVSSSGETWGCPLFYEYFGIRNPEHPDYAKYFFGHWNGNKSDFFASAESISENYSSLSTDNFRTREQPCFLCHQVDRCEICPVMSSLNHEKLEYIPHDICELSHIIIQSRENFFQKKNISGAVQGERK